jgi:hypothetical protein
VLRKIIAGLAGALALIVVPPSSEAEQPIAPVLDLDQKTVAAGDDVTLPMPFTFVWPLYTM